MSLETLAALIDSGVECRDLVGSSEPRLHAKVYMFGNERAVVTSANFTTNGLDRNIEVGVDLSAGEVVDLISWFDSLWSKATRLGEARIDELRLQAAPLLERFKFLRDCSSLLDTPRGKLQTSHALAASHDGSAIKYYFCNTDRIEGLKDEERMMERNYAAAWEVFQHTSHMAAVTSGDIIFMYANGVGIIRIGKALGACERLAPRQKGRISPKAPGEEWRIPVLWLTPVHGDSACIWPGAPPATFQDVSRPVWRRRRNAVLHRLLG